MKVLPLGPREYAVTVTEGEQTTSHKVTLTEDDLDTLGVWEVDEERLVRETVEFLLERETGTAIEHDLTLDAVAAKFDDFYPEVRTRLS